VCDDLIDGCARADIFRNGPERNRTAQPCSDTDSVTVQRIAQFGNDRYPVPKRFQRFQDRCELEIGACFGRGPVAGPLSKRNKHDSKTRQRVSSCFCRRRECRHHRFQKRQGDRRAHATQHRTTRNVCSHVRPFHVFATTPVSTSSERDYSSRSPKSMKKSDSFLSPTHARSSAPPAYRSTRGRGPGHRSSASRLACRQKCPAGAPMPSATPPRHPLWCHPTARPTNQSDSRDWKLCCHHACATRRSHRSFPS